MANATPYAFDNSSSCKDSEEKNSDIHIFSPLLYRYEQREEGGQRSTDISILGGEGTQKRTEGGGHRNADLKIETEGHTHGHFGYLIKIDRI